MKITRNILSFLMKTIVQALFFTILILSFDEVKILFEGEEIILVVLYAVLVKLLADELVLAYKERDISNGKTISTSKTELYFTYAVIIIIPIFWSVLLFYLGNKIGVLLSILMGTISYAGFWFFQKRVN